MGRIRGDRVVRLPRPSIKEYVLACPQGGRPPKHGKEFRFANPETWPEAAITMSAAGAQAVQTHHGGGRIARLAGERQPPQRHLA